MPAANSRTALLHWLWVVPLAAAAWFAGQAVSVAVLALTSLEPPKLPPGANEAQLAAWAFVSALLIALGVAPLSRRLPGSAISRWLVLAAFLWLVNGVNTAIETSIFTTLGGEFHFAFSGLLPALLCAGVLLGVARAEPAEPSRFTATPRGGLAWRLAVAWLAFPAAYLAFGTLIAPFVIDAYSTEGSVVIVPPIGMIIAVQLIRSMLFLLPTLAVIERWTGSPLGLWLALGWAHTALVGLAGLIMPNPIFTPTLRLIHSVEVAADSFAYAGIVVAVLAARGREPRAAALHSESASLAERAR